MANHFKKVAHLHDSKTHTLFIIRPCIYRKKIRL